MQNPINQSYNKSIEELAGELGVDPVLGLTRDEVEHRLTIHGHNRLIDKGSKNPFLILFEQLTSVMVLLLIGAGLLSVILGKQGEAIAIFAVVALFAAFGFVQEYRAERALAALKSMSVPVVKVKRDGKTTEISADELVPGDIVLIEAGTILAADGRIIEARALKIEESALTGESEGVDKTPEALGGDLSLGDRRNMVYRGTQVSTGRGVVLVTETGMKTELGKISAMLQEVKQEATPLQKRLDKAGAQLAALGVVVAVVVMGLGLIAGAPLAEMLLTGISVAVAVIPEGLPAVLTLTLAIGAARMLKRNALIRRLPAVETLGGVTVICSDKTGTLTRNKMSLVAYHDGTRLVEGDALSGPAYSGKEPVSGKVTQAGAALTTGLLSSQALAGLTALALCSDADDHLIGDPTETALIAALHRIGSDKEQIASVFPRTNEWPFDSSRKRMSTLHDIVPAQTAEKTAAANETEAGEGSAASSDAGWQALVRAAREVFADSDRVILVKGAADGVLPRSICYRSGSQVLPLDEKAAERLKADHDELAARGMRVLSVAYKVLASGVEVGTQDDAESDLTFLGFACLMDPPRPEVRDAVARCTQAGIRVVMITGDHPLTAVSIAKQLGFTQLHAVTGRDLEAMDDTQLADAAVNTDIFARVSPEHKLRLVSALQSRGQLVAMTGDGVNDAPALRKADIGVAMGITGTDVSKEAAAMVLQDDNFTTIVAAVEEGRLIFDNIKRFVHYVVAGNLGKVLVMLLWPLPFLLGGLGWDQAAALLPLQLLWLNLITDGFLGVSMGMEAAEKNTMSRKPQDPRVGVFANSGLKMSQIGVILAVLTLAAGAWTYLIGRAEAAQTMMFTVLAFGQIAQAISSRSSGPQRRMRPTIGFSLGIFALQVAALYVPGLSDKFLSLVPLRLAEIAVAVGLGVIAWILFELMRKFRRNCA